jgi:hypothetical protein
MNLQSPIVRTFGVQKSFTQVETGGTGNLVLIQPLIIPSYYIQIVKIELITSIVNPNTGSVSVFVALIRSNVNVFSVGFVNGSTSGIYAAHSAAPHVPGSTLVAQTMETIKQFDPGELIFTQQDPLSIYASSSNDANTFVSMSCLIWYQIVSTI